MVNKALTVAALLGLSASLVVAQSSDCTTQLASVTANLNSVQGSLSSIKKGVKVAAIVVPILGGILLILLGLVIFLLVRGVRKIKTKLPVPKEWGLIRFMRNLDKLELNINTGVSVDVNLTTDVEKKENKDKKEDDDEEKKKKREEEEKRKKREEHKRREEKEDDEETRKRRRERKGKSDREFNLRLELTNKGSIVFRRREIEIDDSYLFARTIFHVTYRGKYKGEEVVIRRFSFPIDSDDLILQEIFEEDQRRIKINGLKHDNLVFHIGTIADDPDYAFVTRYYTRSLYTELVERRAKVTFTPKEIAKIALDISNAVQALHKVDFLSRVVASRNVYLDKDANGGIRAKLDLNFEPSTAGFLYGRQHAYIGPVSWLAPEAIESRKYTSASDSFSFGVFLWELVARADPFEERTHVGVACPLIHKGLRLKVPEDAPQVFKDLITSCFEEDPKSRPSIEHIQKELKGYYDSL